MTVTTPLMGWWDVTGLISEHAENLGRRAVKEQIKHWHYIGVREQTQTLDGIHSSQAA